MKKSIIQYTMLVVLSLTLSINTFSQHYVAVAPTHATVGRPPMPKEGYIWIPDSWRWSDGKYVWVPGSWVPPPYHGAVWSPGVWKKGPHGYYWVKGYWKKKYY